MKDYRGEQFINKLYKNLINEEQVKRSIKRSDIKISNKEDMLRAYFDRLEKAHDRKLELLRYFYHKKYVIKELPEDYVKLQKKIAKERGYGDIDVTKEMKEEMLEELKKEQEASLDKWIDYLTSKDAIYPTWFKYYVFQGIVKLGKFDKEEGEFTTRTKSTVTPFIECNPEILGQMYNIIKKMLNKEWLTEQEEKALANGESFKRLYKYFYVGSYEENENKEETKGVWIKYEQGDDYKDLWKSLQGKNTGWCTAGEETCKTQVKNGDFYVYYTYDKDGKPVNPRIAIRMDGKDKIGEIRGVGSNQNLEAEMIPILDNKLNEFPDKDKYLKKEHDMSLLTKIDNKVQKNEELTNEELMFLYEIDNEIEGFGWSKDPRIEEIKEKRDKKEDISKILGCEKKNVALTKEELLQENEIYVYYGDLKIRDKTVPDYLSKIKYILGIAYFDSLTNAEGLNNLTTIGGIAGFDSLTNTEGLNNLKTIGEDAYFCSLTNAEGLNNLRTIGASVNFYSLTNAEGLNNLKAIGKDAYFRSLTNAEGLNNLKAIGGSAYFPSLTNTEGLNNLKTIGEDAYFPSLTNTEGLNNLKTIGEDANFPSLTNAEGLSNLTTIGGSANFPSLTNLEGLSNLQINWNAFFNGNISVEDLISRNIIVKGNLYIGGTLINKEDIKSRTL